MNVKVSRTKVAKLGKNEGRRQVCLYILLKLGCAPKEDVPKWEGGGAKVNCCTLEETRWWGVLGALTDSE